MTKEETVSLHVQLNKKEFVYFSWYSQYKSIIVTNISALIALIIYFRTLTDLSFTKIILLSTASTLLLCFPGLLFAISIKEKREFKSNYKLREKVFYEINKLGILRSINEEGLLIEWGQLNSIKELKSMFILYHSPTKSIIFPKRAFHSKKDIKVFRKLSSEYMEEGSIHFK